MSVEKKLNIFTYILFTITFFALFLVFSIVPVHAETLYRELGNSYANFYHGNDDNNFTCRRPATDNTYYSVSKGSDDRYKSQFAGLFSGCDGTAVHLTNVMFSSYVLTSQCSDNCDLPFAFSLTWHTGASTTSNNYDLTLSMRTSWILNNYNHVYIVFTDNNDKEWRTRLSTRVLTNGQSTDNDYVSYDLSVYYYLTLYDVKYINYIDIEFPNSYSEQQQFNDNNVQFSMQLFSNQFAYSYMSATGGSNGVDGSDDSAEQIQQLQQETNQHLTDIRLQMLSEEAPDTMGLGSSAGWLPAGPVDSILNLPLTFFNGLLSSLSMTCSPVSVPIPFVNQTFQLPCINSLLNQINGFSTWWTAMGLIASAFILYKYLLHLYKWVDDTLTFRENNWQDWGGI